MSGLDMVLDFFRSWAPEIVVQTIASMSFLTHFSAILKGVIDLRDLIYFLSLIAFWLFANVIIIDQKKAA
jgi:ABC-2 type transport system permease protein